MDSGYHHDHFLGADLHEAVLGALLRRAGDEADVDFTVGDGGHLIHGAHFDRRHNEIREALIEGGIDGRKHGDAPARREPDLQLGLPGVGNVVDAVVGVPANLQGLLCALDIDPAGLRGMPVCAGAVEKLGAQLLLQLEQLLVQGRLGNEEILGCPGNVVFLGDLNDVFKLSEIHTISFALLNKLYRNSLAPQRENEKLSVLLIDLVFFCDLLRGALFL